MTRVDAFLLDGTRTERALRQSISIAIGVGVSAAIFISLARVQHQPVSQLPSTVEDLRAVALPVQPPPPPTHQEETVPVFEAATIQLAASPSPDSAVKLPAAPIPSDSVPPARAIPRFDVSPGTAKPNADVVDRDIQRIYSRAEVDQRPLAIFRKMPEVTQAEINAMKTMRATFLMVAGIDGTVSTINLIDGTGSPEVDAACVAALREWRFKPAVRKGRTVRCWVQQSLVFKIHRNSPFEAHPE